ncbi:MAG: hypothetical protein A2842_02730 [Candidatus Wildermuthbacteria bacterium RIFCSPHIGHO2_01_FULL_48_25]|uniref:Transcriptional repressor PaaX-like central Cas2-like domain-containing protein n=1 Tax=Candidatus Wildermuthbacteria bacterium RIFCSPLOWO2_01_FULL_48_16 TaxID=1802461 RepID=A0A1G2RJJ7_9BACT|nr:MAG: hypothetical protein A2842_02730 [Candidatus Wildermuthbacteria bacterium RIFCSPHIGHO2_01_FULL_48_25]OHA68170.1 MAG: hypothetical protein A3J57_02095 [Candidatus Wildermuthbacteria bacterium RIFCSPHIGHO2_02_FULL_49_12b]OHA73016.1 MAG: hypothetical protein A3B24_01215 [Candidatus Wildermuthbacteria bacterium RIFCSPLOWO2_01_FULL_48_16]
MPRLKGTVSQEILHNLLIGGAFVLAAQSPYFWLNFYKNMFNGRGFRSSQVRDAFKYLRKKKLIYIETHNKQIYLRLTEEGEKEAGKFQINKLKVDRPKKWDGKWRLIIFDIPEKLKVKREAFRGKLKELGFYRLQKSIWAHAFPCEAQVHLLREFFALSPKHLRVLEVQKLEDDNFLKEFFSVEK